MFRGWLRLDGAEVSNTSRTIAHLTPPIPTSDDDIAPSMPCACDYRIPYDDSWTGLREALDDPPYVITDAPWYSAARPESAELAGFWIMQVDGMDSVPLQRDTAESICAGGVAARARDTTRPITFSALVIACTNAGVQYGVDWLSCTLRRANVQGGVEMEFWKAHPQDTAATPESLFRIMRGLVLTSPPVKTEVLGKGGLHRHRQAAIYRVDWEMVATNPYMYGTATAIPVNWDTITSESITWAHAPDCDDPASCGLPTIYNADCIPPDVDINKATIPTCGGCLPICDIERRTWEMPTSPGVCDDTVISVRVTNNGPDPLTVLMYWQPCGSTDQCEREHPLQVSGLAQGQTAVADSITGRPFVDIGGIQHRQVGIVSTPTGAPWRPIVLDSLLCWELVAESAPGADYTVTIETRDRDA